MDGYIRPRLDQAKELLESGVQYRNGKLVNDARLLFDSLRTLTTDSEYWETVKENVIRACTMLCILDEPNALQHLEFALRYDPNHPTVLNNLGFIYHMKWSNWTRSIENYEACLLADPTYITAYLGIIDVYRILRHHQLEYEYCQKGVRNCPESSQLHNALGLAMLNMQLFDDLNKISQVFERALVCNDIDKVTRAKVFVNMGHINGLCGDFEAGLMNYLDAIDNDPTHQAAYNNILMNVHYLGDADMSGSVVKALKKKFKIGSSSACRNMDSFIDVLHKKIVDQLYVAPLGDSLSELPQLNTENVLSRKIVVGYVSSDLISHAVSFFVGCLLAGYNETAFDVYVYSNNVYDAGQIADIRCTGYRCIKGATATDVVKQIQSDKVDILIDLSGHTAGNRLDVFALNPAPVLLSYCGYPNNTGFKNVKRISDVYTEKFNTNERIVLCRSPHLTSEPVNPPSNVNGLTVLTLERLFLCYTPKLVDKVWLRTHVKSFVNFKPTTGKVVFGCFAKLPKINQHVIDLWIQILLQVPKATLVLKSKCFQDVTFQMKWLNKFGTVRDRVQLLEGTQGPDQHMELYKTIDIHLDTFPYSGTTITTESLYMNVPVVTLSLVSGASTSVGHVQRVSGSILTSMGLAQDLVANTKEDYVAKAVALVNKLPNLPSVRKKFLTSDISKPKDFLTHFEMALSDQFLARRNDV